MKRIKLIAAIITIINLISCQNEKKQNNLEKTDRLKNDLNLDGHTFFKITETDSGKVLYKPCDASIESYKFYRDSLYHNWGQEFDRLKKISFKKNKSIYILEAFNTNANEKNIIKIEKINAGGHYLKINNETFIDSLYFKTIPWSKQSIKDCEESFGINDSILVKKDIVFNTINHVKGIEFAFDCNSSDYVYFLVGGQFITSKLSMNTKLETINFTEFNIYFSKPLLTPINKNFSDSEYFSELIPIAKANHRGNKLELTWYGFYNTKTNKKVHLENPFTDRIEKEPIVLSKCNK